MLLAGLLVASLLVAPGAGADTADGFPLAGDWNGDGRTTPGWYLDGEVLLRNATSTGAADIRFSFGRRGDLPIVGDWDGDGRDTLGVIRGTTWYLRNDNSSGPADLSFVFGRVGDGDIALAGDWDGDGRDGVGIVRGGEWHLRNSPSGGPADIVLTFGRGHRGDIPLAGDWTGDGRDTPAIVRNGTWNIRETNSSGEADHVLRYGRPHDVPVSGDWNGAGHHTPGIVRDSEWYLRDSLGRHSADHVFTFGPEPGNDDGTGSEPDDGSPEASDVDDDSHHNHQQDGHSDDDIDHGQSSDDADVLVTGHQAAGFTVPAGQTWQVKGEVTTTENVVVYGTLRMRAGSTITFVDVDEGAFVGGGMDVIDSDVGLWVMGSGRLDIHGTPKQGWNRTGAHETWDSDDEYVLAPHSDEREPQPWTLGEDVPCVEFAQETYCAEVVNLTRDVVIQGTSGGASHIFVRSDQPQTVKYATLRHMGPNGNGPVDGRYAIHFHHAHDGSRGTIVEGVVVLDSGDHAFVPHESHGITFRDTVAYKVRNTPYWWDPGDHSNDIRYEGALAMDVREGRDSGARLTGFRMARGLGNACISCTAVRVRGGHPSSGFGWIEHTPNKWEFRDSVSHHNNNGVYHWRNEPHAGDAVHDHHDFVAYSNSRFGIIQGAYSIQARWHGIALFDNGMHRSSASALINQGSPRSDLSPPGIVYRGGAIGGNTGGPPIAIRSMASCPKEGNFILFENLQLLDWDDEPIHVDKSDCDLHGGHFDVRFRDVVVGPEKRDLQPDDFLIEAIPSDGVITVHRKDGTAFTIPG